MAYDVFVSYRRKDVEAVAAFVRLLEDIHHLKVWRDQQNIENFESTSAAIRDGLTQSRTLLAWYSSAYPASRPCQWELTTAYVAARGMGDVRDRLLVINPEPTNAHIHPIELRDENFGVVSTSAPGALEGLAANVRRHLDSLDGAVFGSRGDLTPPQSYGHHVSSSNRFVGRLPDLWRIHSGLHPIENVIVASSRVPVVQIVGLGGMGKTLLAEEYAIRFGAAFPGGIFWMNAANPSAETRETQRRQQLSLFAAEQGFTGDPSTSTSVIRAFLRKKLSQGSDTPRPFLWMVDDVPGDVSRSEFEEYLPPHPSGKTLITTRSHQHDAIGTVLNLEALDPDAAVALLLLHCPVRDKRDETDAAGLAADVGYHPIAVELAGAAIRLSAGTLTFRDYRQRLADPRQDALEFAARLGAELPTGHEKSIASTLLSGLEGLSAEGLDLLRIAAHIASAPIPAQLIASTFELAESLDPIAAQEHALVACSDCEQRSLADLVRDAEGSAWTVHVLVRRTIRFHDPDESRQTTLRHAAAVHLISALSDVDDVRTHRQHRLHVIHARQLLSTDLTPDVLIGLLERVARFDHEGGDYASAIRLSTRRVEVCTRVYGGIHAHTLRALGDLGRGFQGHGQSSAAFAVNKEVVRGRMHLLGPDHIDSLTALHNLANSISTRRIKKAVALHRYVLSRRVQLLGPEHPHTLFSLNNLGTSLAGCEEYAEARGFLEQAFRVRQRRFGDDHQDTLSSKSSLADVLFAVGNVAEARRLKQEVLDTRLRIAGQDHPLTLLTSANLGRFLIADGHSAEARTLLEGAAHRALETLGPAHDTTRLLMNNAGKACLERGDAAAARTWCARALEGYELNNEDEPFDSMRIRFAFNLFDALHRLGAHQQAEAVFDQFLSGLWRADPTTLKRAAQALRNDVQTVRQRLSIT